jgi:uncharacterized protein
MTSLVGAPIGFELGSYDPDAELSFYTELFGWTVDDPVPGMGDYRTVSLNGELVAGVNPAPAKDGWAILLGADDAVETSAKVELAGGTIEGLPAPFGPFGTRADFVDPTGARVSALQPGDRAFCEVVRVPGAVTWCELHTKDFAAAVPFYLDALGWDAVDPLSDTDEFRMVTFPAGAGDDAIAGIFEATDDQLDPESLWHLYFEVDDVDASAAKVDELGGMVILDPEDSPYGRLAFVVDGAGIPFWIMKPAA